MQVLNGIEWSIQDVTDRHGSGWVEWSLLGYDSEGKEFIALGQGFEEECIIRELDQVEETGNYLVTD